MVNKEYFNRKKILIGLIVAVFIAIIAISVIALIHNAIHNASIKLIFAPKDSQIIVDGVKLKFGDNQVRPGEYNITISHAGFESQTKTVSVGQDEHKDIYFILESNDSSTADWYETHEEDKKICEGIASWSYDNQSGDTANLPILKLLPHYSANYSIGYGNCSEYGGSPFCFTINASFGFRDAATRHLLNMAEENVEQYEIRYINYHNLFENISDIKTTESHADYNDHYDRENIDETEFNDVLSVANRCADNISNQEVFSAEVYQIKILDGNYSVFTMHITKTPLDITHEGGVTSSQQNSNSGLHDTYRAVLEKIDGNWELVTLPVIVFSEISQYNIPAEVIKAANQL